MFMHKTLMDMIKKLEAKIESRDSTIKYKEERIKELTQTIDRLNTEASFAKRELSIQVEEAKNALRKDMQKSLIESDLKRVKAESALETYEKMDTKSDHEHITKMLEESIKGLARDTKINVIQSK